MLLPSDLIAAIATPAGIGGVGIVRVSGPGTIALAEAILGFLPNPRMAHFSRFRDARGEVIDEGIALFFPNPGSFTGEDVLELQGHGGPVVMDLLLQRCLECGARIAEPGEFSRRAFLNGKLDLAQAEAIADLIESDTATAARLAMRSLEGEFSTRIHRLVERLVNLRTYVEAAIDFPEEEIDFLSDGKVSTDLHEISTELDAVIATARIGTLLREGMTLVIAGRPNAGKSSLLNALSGRDCAIVTALPGTTRDLLRERIEIDGMPLHLIDTAGLRESGDPIEREGVRRAREQIGKADQVLWIFDDQLDPAESVPDLSTLPLNIPITLVRNKIDLTGRPPGIRETPLGIEVSLSALSHQGLDLLRQHLRQSAGYSGSQEGAFIARRRHLDALRKGSEYLLTGAQALTDAAGELLAEDLRHAQYSLSEITGEFTSDDLLGHIFSSFCIGK
ncbi:MAG: tRNA uridine-5-carboxymethylaminomethyl(34) synthesis GTPase MnmE [Chromatiaceae bacterium]|nr:tRNA uridine-5-carboxymethylaminomethyl(34) synthesis GTPase MnmE [Chromatiaceae bacterium]